MGKLEETLRIFALHIQQSNAAFAEGKLSEAEAHTSSAAKLLKIEWCGAILIHFSENALSRETEKFITGNYTSLKYLRIF